MRSLIPVAAAALTLTACSKTLASFEGEITMHTTVAAGGAHDMVVETKGDKLRFDVNSDGEASHAVYDPSTNKVLLFFDGPKKYADLDFGTPSSAPNTDPGTSTITKAGTHKTIAGYECDVWSVKDVSGKHSEVCIAEGIAFFDINGLRPGAPRTESPLARQFREHKSFPLESIDYDAQGKELSRMEVVKIEKSKLDDSTFAIPSGYTKLEMPKPR